MCDVEDAQLHEQDAQKAIILNQQTGLVTANKVSMSNRSWIV